MSNVFDRLATEQSQHEDGHDTDAPPSHEVLAASAKDDDGIGRTSFDTRSTVQELLKHGYLEESDKKDLFRRVIVNERAINMVLEPLDLTLRIDSHRGVAFLAVAQELSESPSEDEGWTHPLVRKQRLTLEQSLLVAILRQAFVLHEQESGVGQSDARIAVDELLPHFLTYFGDSGSDSKNESRLLQLLDQLKTYGIVSEVDKKQEVTIRPLIAHVANPESLTALLDVLKQKHAGRATLEGGDEC